MRVIGRCVNTKTILPYDVDFANGNNIFQCLFWYSAVLYASQELEINKMQKMTYSTQYCKIRVCFYLKYRSAGKIKLQLFH